jgi:cytoskeletal protein CcmA (bactofilin family)
MRKEIEILINSKVELTPGAFSINGEIKTHNLHQDGRPKTSTHYA